jgi:hypothetical protein
VGGSMKVSTAQRAALSTLAPLLEPDTYLAGDVAITLSLDHRTSEDLDLFVPRTFDADRLAEHLFATLPPGTDARETGRARGTLDLEIGGVPVTVLAYRYALLSPPRLSAPVHVAVASLEDLLCMKLAAVANRNAAKDFWDIDALLTHGVAGGSLAGALASFTRKYPHADPGHVLRSLAYFEEADADPLPRGLDAAEWSALKARMRARVTEV